MDRQGYLDKYSFTSRRNLAICSTDVTLKGSIFQRVGAAVEKVLLPLLVIILGTKSISEVDDRSCTDFLTGVSNDCI